MTARRGDMGNDSTAANRLWLHQHPHPAAVGLVIDFVMLVRGEITRIHQIDGNNAPIDRFAQQTRLQGRGKKVGKQRDHIKSEGGVGIHTNHYGNIAP